ncbi:MAG: hypothetical protein U9R14_01630 [Patescibacteria group bacterium]|nr:hypothetical protein [Patescibacteria group bacterium]
MYNIIPLTLILISLSIIIVIVVRKFSAIASLDADNIPAEKEAKFKERIISDRFKRNFTKWSFKLTRLLRPAVQAIGVFSQRLFNKLNELKESYKDEIVLPAGDVKQKIERLFNEAEESEKQNDSAMAEKQYIGIIGMDSKNIRAFRALGRLYFKSKDYEKASQTFEHVLKLKEDDEDTYGGLSQVKKSIGVGEQPQSSEQIMIQDKRSQTYFDLALAYQAMGKMDRAAASIKKSLQIESNNPRYLDTALEMSIIIKDKALALDAYKKFKEINPDNQKLAEFKKQIDEL